MILITGAAGKTERAIIQAVLQKETAVAHLLSTHLGKPVNPEQIAHDVWTMQAKANGLTHFQIETLLKMFDYTANCGLIGNSNVLAWLLGRRPTRFAQFIARDF